MSAADIAISVAGLSGVVLVGWLSWRSPSWAIGLVVASVPLQAFARIGSGGSGVTWTQAWLWTILAVGAVLFTSGMLKADLDLTTASFAIVVVCYIVSRQAAVDVAAWRNEVYRWSVALAFLLVARGMSRSHGSVMPLILVAALGATWTGIVAIVQVAGGVGPASFERSGQTRAYATFGEPNTYGAFAAGGLVVLAAVLLHDRMSLGSWEVAAVAIGCAFGAVGLTLSQSRGALAATAVVLAAMVLVKVSDPDAVPQAARIAVVVGVAGLTLLVTPRVIAEVSRWGDDVEVTSASWADQERLAHWGAATRMVVDSSGLGVGAGQFDVRYREVTPTWRFRIPQGHAHNAYLQVAAEAGLIGIGAYLAMLAAAGAGFLRSLRRSGPTSAVVAAVAATAVFALHNLVDYLHVLNLPIILMAWWATAHAQSEGPTATS